MKVYRILTDRAGAYKEDCVKAGDIVYAFYGVTYGCISDNGIAVTLVPDKHPFFEVPKDAVEEVVPIYLNKDELTLVINGLSFWENEFALKFDNAKDGFIREGALKALTRGRVILNRMITRYEAWVPAALRGITAKVKEVE